jgi:hypothetical protein
MLLQEIAHARAGDKGNIVTIAVVARRIEDFPLLEQRLTAEKVTDYFSELIDSPVVRYAIPHLGALNFVLHRPGSEAVTQSLALDAHGKCLSSAMLGIQI